MNSAYSPARLADRLMIQDLLYRWSRAIDRLDLESIRRVFHPGATDIHGPFNGDVDGLVDWIRGRHKTVVFSSHAVGNILIEFASENIALVESYVRTIQQYSAEGAQSLSQLVGPAAIAAGRGATMMTASRYVDRIERRDGEWRVAHRTLVHEWKQIFELPDGSPSPASDWVVGRRDSHDYIFQQRASLGIDGQ